MCQMKLYDNVCLYVVLESESRACGDHHCVCQFPDNPHPYTGPTHTDPRMLSAEQTDKYQHA